MTFFEVRLDVYARHLFSSQVHQSRWRIRLHAVGLSSLGFIALGGRYLSTASGSSLICLLLLFLLHSIRKESRKSIVFVPLVIGSQRLGSASLLVTAYLQAVQMCKMSLGADMGEEVRNVTEGRLFGTDSAIEEIGSHSRRYDGRSQK